MTDLGNKIIPFRRPDAQKPGAEGPSEEGTTREKREERFARQQARASRIRSFVDEFQGKLTFDQRLSLATNLGRLLFGDGKKRKRGWITELLLEAEVSKRPEDHTKRLPRYVIRDGRKPRSPKELAAKPEGYARIAEAFADAENLHRDRTLVDVFQDVGIDEVGGEQVADDALMAYLPLYRLIMAFSRGVIQGTSVAGYIRDLERWRWISSVDLHRRDDQSFGFAPEIEVNNRWLHDTNFFGEEPGDVQFYEDRLRILPKVCLAAGPYIPFEIENVDTFWASMGNEAKHAKLEIDRLFVTPIFGVWLVIAPLGPNQTPCPCFSRLWNVRVLCEYRLDGVRKEFDSRFCMTGEDVVARRQSPETPSLFELYSPSEDRFTLGFQLGDDAYVTLQSVISDGELGDEIKQTMSSALARSNRLEPVTLSNIPRYLSEKIDVEMGEAFPTDTACAAPFGTRAHTLEINLREDSGLNLQAEFIGDVECLQKRMTQEIERLEMHMRGQERELVAKLSPENSKQEEKNND